LFRRLRPGPSPSRPASLAPACPAALPTPARPSSGYWSIGDNASIAVAPGTKGTFTNLGNLTKVGDTGVATIAADLYNNGSVFVLTGMLDIASVVRGKGSFAVGKHATLEFGTAVAAAESVDFGGVNSATLLLDDARTFRGTVAGLVAGDTIDLAGFAPANATLAYTANSGNTGGILDVRSGANRATVALDGQFLASAFHSMSDGHGGTNITYGTQPQAMPQLAASQA
jgi:hypothetical protein